MKFDQQKAKFIRNKRSISIDGRDGERAGRVFDLPSPNFDSNFHKAQTLIQFFGFVQIGFFWPQEMDPKEGGPDGGERGEFV